MLLSEMFGVERDVDFEVIGYFGRFILREQSDGTERLWWRRLKDTNVYVNADLDVVYDIILKAPSGIIHLPPPLTDEQRVVLMALYTLGYRRLAKDENGATYAYDKQKLVKGLTVWLNPEKGCSRIHEGMAEEVIIPLVSWSDPEPYDIGKALGGVGE